MENSELTSFIATLIDINKPRNKNFLDDLLKRLKSPSILETHDYKVFILIYEIIYINIFLMDASYLRSTKSLS